MCMSEKSKLVCASGESESVCMSGNSELIILIRCGRVHPVFPLNSR